MGLKKENTFYGLFFESRKILNTSDLTSSSIFGSYEIQLESIGRLSVN